MPSKRPAPLSDDLFKNAGQQQPLGVTNNGQPLPVKNTFIDVPSGLTPSGMASASGARSMIMTAPADINQPQGFLQRAMAASVQTQPAPLASIPPSPSPAAATRPRILSQSQGYPLMTPSPTHAAMMVQQGSNTVHSGFQAALTLAGAGVSLAPVPSVASSTPQLPATTFPPYLSSTIPATSSSSVLGYTPMTSLAPGAPTYTLAPATSKSTYGAAQYPTLPNGTVPAQGNLLYGQSVQYRRPSIVGASKAMPTENLEEGDDEEDNDDDSDGEPTVPPHLRNPENAPKPPPGAEHPSIGSEGHAAGQCKRCCFFPRGRCNNGYTCDFCHYEHEKRKRKNKKKKKKDSAANAAIAAHTVGIMPMLTTGIPTTDPRQPVVQTLVAAPATAMHLHGGVVYHQPQPVAAHVVPTYMTHPLASTPSLAAAQHYATWEPMPGQVLQYASPTPATTHSGLNPPFQMPQVSQDHVPPPPMHSPKVHQPLCPPPMGSPRLPRNIQQTLQGQMAASAATAAAASTTPA
mmetsp:Transcript_13848/g.37610  ORF Transcript_13848/g.37610 Transcript_13848/m.37610 type:complete len:518 (-) Transcript_13848:99-1652(-)